MFYTFYTMKKFTEIKGAARIIDANINRAKEGLRVCEEIARFILNNHKLTSEFKKIRHQLDSVIRPPFGYPVNLLTARNSLKDIGRNIYINELERRNFQDIFFANIQRVKESIRVLEEFTKLVDNGLAVKFKKIRYGIYEIEKKTAGKISALRSH